MALVEDRNGILADGLVPIDDALVAIQLEADLTILELFLSHLCALSRAYCVEVVAVVELHRTAAEGVAVVCACTFGEGAGGEAVVQRGRAVTCICHEAAVHRAAGITHRAERSTIVEGDRTFQSSEHASVAGHVAAVACDVDIRHDILDECCAVGPSGQCAEVDSRHDGIALDTKVADGGAVQVAEHSAVVVAYLIAVGDGVALSVERAGELSIFVAYHEAGIVALAQVDVRHELGIDVRSAAIHQACEDEVVLRGTEQIVAVLFIGEELNHTLGVDGQSFLGGHGAVDVAIDELGVEVVHLVELLFGENAREGIQQVVHLFRLVHEGNICLLALVDLQEEARELLDELVLCFGLGGSSYGLERLLKLVLECLAEVGISCILVGEVELVFIEDGACAVRLRCKYAVQALVGFVQLSVVEHLDVAESEPVARESRTRLTDADGQGAVGHLAEHAVGIASGLEGVAAADDALHRVACQLLLVVPVGHGKVGNGAVDVAVLAVDGIFGADHVLDVSLEVVVDAVGIECSGVVDVVEVGVGCGTEGAVHLQLVDAVGQSRQGLVHVHRL